MPTRFGVGLARLALVLAVAIGACRENPDLSRPVTGPAIPVDLTGSGPATLDLAKDHDVVNGHFHLRVTKVANDLGTANGVDIAALAEQALSKIDQLLPGPSVAITIVVSREVITEIGMGGTTTRGGEILISIDPEPPRGVAATVATWLPPTLAHELHHSRRILAGPGYGNTVGQAIVSEGLADSFAREAYPSTPPTPWTQLNFSAQRRTWDLTKPHLNDILRPGTNDARQWLWGGGRLPQWAGYRLGFQVVASYLENHPGATAGSLVTTPADTIINESGYDEKVTGEQK